MTAKRRRGGEPHTGCWENKGKQKLSFRTYLTLLYLPCIQRGASVDTMYVRSTLPRRQPSNALQPRRLLPSPSAAGSSRMTRVQSRQQQIFRAPAGASTAAISLMSSYSCSRDREEEEEAGGVNGVKKEAKFGGIGGGGGADGETSSKLLWSDHIFIY
jgi:hypothetical protein